MFDLLAGVQDGISRAVAFARAVDQEWATAWEHEHGSTVIPLAPKGLPRGIGYGAVSILREFGFVPPKHDASEDLYGKPRAGRCRVRQVGVFTWPPEETEDHFGFSWLNQAELALVAERYALLPQGELESIDGGPAPESYAMRVPPPDGTRWRLVTGIRNREIDAVVAMMAALNEGDPDRTRFMFWFGS